MMNYRINVERKPIPAATVMIHHQTLIRALRVRLVAAAQVRLVPAHQVKIDNQ